MGNLDFAFLLRFMVMVMAVARVTRILVDETIAEPIRKAVGIYHNDAGKKITHDDTFLAQLLWCFWCTSVWISAAFVLVYALSPFLFDILSIPFAVSWAAIALYEKVY